MRIAIVGTGNVGGALGRVWSAKGHEIVFGAREPKSAKVAELVKSLGTRVRADAPAAAAQSSEIVVFATPWAGTREAVESCGKLEGKLVIDCTNPLALDLSGLTVGQTNSGGEEVARWAKGAAVFKAFNTTGAENMARAREFAAKPVMFFCGDNDAWRPSVTKLIEDAGFDCVDAGPLAAARLLEPLALLWIQTAYRGGMGTSYAFALERRGR